MSVFNSGGRREATGPISFDVHWPLVISVLLLGMAGVLLQYSVAGGDFSPWAWRHTGRLMLGLLVMLVIAALSVRTIFSLSYAVYAIVLLMLLGVEFFGVKSMGAQRWLDFGVARVQPSEFIRLGLILALARFYQSVYHSDVSRPMNLLIPLVMIGLPCLLIFRQPDLGTMIMLAVTGLSVVFLAGVRRRYFIGGGLAVLAAIPLVWQNMLTYQKERVLVFLDPNRDPLGAGYHIIQSKIGIGSGGLWGKGLVEGTQSRLNFLPEKHTDFIFTIFAEELGFFVSLGLLLLFMLMLFFIFQCARQMRSQYARLVSASIGVSISFYIVVNLAMVMGLAPVVGVPLPLVSYGGTSLLTFMVSIGVVLSLERHALTEISRG
jgi:rod shape determining protein RodA